MASIASVDIETYGPGYEIVKDANPGTPYRAKFSIAYCVAAALLEGCVGLEQFTDYRFDGSRVVDDRIATLLGRIKVTVHDDLTAMYPARWPTRLVVSLRDGTQQRGASDYPRGNPENPVSTSTLEEKFLGLVAPRFGDERARQALEAVRSIDGCDDVRGIFA